MPRGRTPEPAALKVLAGSRPDRLNPSEPKPASGRPDVPPHLDGEARAEWDRILPELESMGVLSRVDGPALAIYCRAYGRAVRAQQALDEHGLFVTSGRVVEPATGETAEVEVKSGVVKSNPAAAVLATAEATMLRVLTAFGCDPAARSKVSLKDTRPADKLGAFLGKRKAR